MSPGRLRWLLNLYPPYLGTGIYVRSIDMDFRKIHVEMKQRWYNRNYVNVHFGGSLYAMTDPFYMLMFIQILGPGYVVWDKRASVEFLKPGRGTVTARFEITDDQITEVMERTSGGSKFLNDYVVDVTDTDGDVVARVTKGLYFRPKPAAG